MPARSDGSTAPAAAQPRKLLRLGYRELQVRSWLKPANTGRWPWPLAMHSDMAAAKIFYPEPNLRPCEEPLS